MFIFPDVLLTASLGQPGSGWMQGTGPLMRAWTPQGRVERKRDGFAREESGPSSWAEGPFLAMRFSSR